MKTSKKLKRPNKKSGKKLVIKKILKPNYNFPEYDWKTSDEQSYFGSGDFLK